MLARIDLSTFHVVRVYAVGVVGIAAVYVKRHERRAVIFAFMPCALCLEVKVHYV